MKPQDLARQFAAWLLKQGHRLAPPHAREWGEAMLGELEFVEGSWAALAWAAGGTRVLTAECLRSLFTGPRRQLASAAGGLPGGEVPMKRIALWLSLAGLGLFAVFFLAPTFRQALQATAASWRFVSGKPMISAHTLDRLAQQARAERDGETLAFVALQLRDRDEGLRMAREAVRLDPNLTWIYAVLIQMHPEANYPPELVRSLQAWDPQNAFPYLVEADQRLTTGVILTRRESEDTMLHDAEWLRAMDLAAHAPKFDSYYSRRVSLDREVLWRRHLYAPLVTLHDMTIYPSLAASLPLYVNELLKAGEGREASGDFGGASGYYWTVARLGQTLERGARSDLGRIYGDILMKQSYARLEPLAQKSGNRELAALLAYDLERLRAFPATWSENNDWAALYQANADYSLIAIAGLAISAILFLAGGTCWAAFRWVFRAVPARARRISAAVAAVGAIVLPVSALALYLSYRPLAAVYQHFLWNTGSVGAEPLSSFFGFGAFRLDVHKVMLLRELPWYFLLFVCAGLVAIEGFRFLSRHVRARPLV